MSSSSPPAPSSLQSDFSSLVDSSLPGLEFSLRASPSGAANEDSIQQFLALEKKTRLGGDSKSTVRVAAALLNGLAAVCDWSKLNEILSVLSKRRSQMQKVIEALIVEGLKILTLPAFSSPTAVELRRCLIETLRSISAGKMFVELERARLTKSLAELEEARGKIATAAEILQEIQVETIGTMEAKEKVEFLLEQMRLCLAKRDFVRSEIIAKKVDLKVLNTPEVAQAGLKTRFFKLQIAYFTHSAQYFPIALAWREILNGAELSAPEAAESPAFKEAAASAVLFGLLSEFDSELSDFLQRLKADKRLAGLGIFKHLLELFCGSEVITWPLKYEKELKAHEAFAKTLEGDEEGSEAEEAARDVEAEGIIKHNRFRRWRDLRKRVVQHNLRILSKYYSRIRSARLAALLNLTEDEGERFLSELVSSKQLYARIDRPSGLIEFRPPQREEEILESWSGDLNNLLGKIDTATHLINKQKMAHKIK